jgi:protein O-mannosyl-transferase
LTTAGNNCGKREAERGHLKKLKSQKSKQERKGGRRKHTSTSPSAEPKAGQHSDKAQAPAKIIVLVSLVLVGLILYIYAPSWRYGFLTYDDAIYVSQNPQVSHGLTRQGFIWAFTTGHAANWHPVTWLSHMLDVQIFGMAAGLHHLINVIFHIANTLLLFWLLLRITGSSGRSAVIAALFAVHPLHVESVAWIAERKDVLSTFLGFLTIHAYVNYVRKPRQSTMLGVALIYALGLMAKPMLVTLPFLMILLDLWPLRRMHFEPRQLHVLKQLIFEKAPLFIFAGLSCIATVAAQSRGRAVASMQLFPLHLRAANAAVSYAVYIGKMLWPSNLIPSYFYRPSPAWLVLSSISILLLITIFAIRIGSRYPFVVAGWLWYLVSLFPVIGLLQVGVQARADRYTYIPIIGLFVIAVWGATELLNSRRQKIMLAVAAGSFVGLLAVAARNQVGYWKNDFTLWDHAVRTDPGNSYARSNYADALMSRGDLAGAVEQLTEALRITPLAETHDTLGIALYKRGLVSEALTHHYAAIRLNPQMASAHANLGIIFLSQKKIEEAAARFREALKLDPQNPEILYDSGLALTKLGKNEEAVALYKTALGMRPSDPALLGNILFALGKHGEAVEQYENSLKMKPDSASAEMQNSFGVALYKQGMLNEALPHYYEAIRIKPGFADPHSNLGIILSSQNRIQEGMAQFREALKLDPQNPEILYNLGLTLARRGNNEEAIMLYKAALEINPSYADARRELGNALFVRGKYGEAVEQYAISMKIKPDSAKTHNNMGLALRLLHREKEAVDQFHEALRIDPNCIEAQRNLADAAYR